MSQRETSRDDGGVASADVHAQSNGEENYRRQPHTRGQFDECGEVDEFMAQIDPSEHRRLLAFVNEANAPEQLMYRRAPEVDGADPRAQFLQERPDRGDRRRLLSREAALALLRYRDAEFPLGFRHLRELLGAHRFSLKDLLELLRAFSNALFGSWSVFPQSIPRRGPNRTQVGVVHAALLHTGRVLFITADETTLLWDPTDTTAAAFTDPVNQPQSTPPGEGYSVLCSGHCFLSSGELLAVGGGGYGPHELARWGYRFDPVFRTWTRTSGPMHHHRWYPTALRIGDHRLRGSREVLIVCGHGGGDMEIYDEATDSFREVLGDTKPFPQLYPGLHLLPTNVVLYSRTGWGSAEANGPEANEGEDDQSKYFLFTGQSAGLWTNTSSTTARPDRTKGMSVMILGREAPHVRILSLGGADPATNDTYELIDATVLSPAATWGPVLRFPDGEHRSLASAVLLPDGKVFVAGGIQRTNSPCTMFDPGTNQWAPMAALPSQRDYHSVALLLPSGEVMMAGWRNTSIEVYKPPYLFSGPRPLITSAPERVRHGQTFVVECSVESHEIAKVVFVRPMCVTHQMDTEQRVIALSFDGSANDPRLTVKAPNSGPPYALAPEGYYMLFLVSRKGVPSVARWIHLAPPETHFWSHVAVSQAAAGPGAAGDAFGYVFHAQDTQHIIYRSNDGHIRELWWDGT